MAGVKESDMKTVRRAKVIPVKKGGAFLKGSITVVDSIQRQKPGKAIEGNELTGTRKFKASA